MAQSVVDDGSSETCDKEHLAYLMNHFDQNLWPQLAEDYVIAASPGLYLGCHRTLGRYFWPGSPFCFCLPEGMFFFGPKIAGNERPERTRTFREKHQISVI